jgi:hypothetical protein
VPDFTIDPVGTLRYLQFDVNASVLTKPFFVASSASATSQLDSMANPALATPLDSGLSFKATPDIEIRPFRMSGSNCNPDVVHRVVLEQFN